MAAKPPASKSAEDGSGTAAATYDRLQSMPPLEVTV
jgi:hypothetical protein